MSMISIERKCIEIWNKLGKLIKLIIAPQPNFGLHSIGASVILTVGLRGTVSCAGQPRLVFRQ